MSYKERESIVPRVRESTWNHTIRYNVVRVISYIPFVFLSYRYYLVYYTR